MDREREQRTSITYNLSLYTHTHLFSLNLSSSMSQTTSSNKTLGPKGPRTAIIVYTLHGHIGSREFHTHTAFPALFAYPLPWLFPVAESIKAGVESGGGNPTMYQ